MQYKLKNPPLLICDHVCITKQIVYVKTDSIIKKKNTALLHIFSKSETSEKKRKQKTKYIYIVSKQLLKYYEKKQSKNSNP